MGPILAKVLSCNRHFVDPVVQPLVSKTRTSACLYTVDNLSHITKTASGLVEQFKTIRLIRCKPIHGVLKIKGDTDYTGSLPFSKVSSTVSTSKSKTVFLYKLLNGFTPQIAFRAILVLKTES